MALCPQVFRINLIKKSMWLSPNQMKNMEYSLEIDAQNHFSLKALRDPDLDYFSKSDRSLIRL